MRRYAVSAALTSDGPTCCDCNAAMSDDRMRCSPSGVRVEPVRCKQFRCVGAGQCADRVDEDHAFGCRLSRQVCHELVGHSEIVAGVREEPWPDEDDLGARPGPVYLAECRHRLLERVGARREGIIAATVEQHQVGIVLSGQVRDTLDERRGLSGIRIVPAVGGPAADVPRSADRGQRAEPAHQHRGAACIGQLGGTLARGVRIPDEQRQRPGFADRLLCPGRGRAPGRVGENGKPC